MASVRLTKWQRVAVSLAERVGRDRLEPSVVELADQSGRRKWVVAVSGGADSVALLLLVWAHWPQHRDRLVLAHFDHHLRGSESSKDRQFCQRVARSLGLVFEFEVWETPPESPSEAQARTVRLSFLENVRRRHRAGLIWTGHQQNDVAETMLMRIARGSGTAGLAAPRAVQSNVGGGATRVRPLLDLPQVELSAALKAAGGEWREDASNRGSQFFRNRVRHEVIPAWVRAAERDAINGAGRSRRLLAEDDDALEAWLAEINPIDVHGRLVLARLKAKPTAIWRRILHQWLLRQTDPGDLSRRGFDELLKMARNGRTTRFSLGKSGFVRIRRGFLFFEQPLLE